MGAGRGDGHLPDHCQRYRSAPGDSCQSATPPLHTGEGVGKDEPAAVKPISKVKLERR